MKTITSNTCISVKEEHNERSWPRESEQKELSNERSLFYERTKKKEKGFGKFEASRLARGYPHIGH